jgi:hypothetical protein
MVWFARATHDSRGGQPDNCGLEEAPPECGAQPFKKNSHIHPGKQNHQSEACGRHFVLHGDNWVVVEEQRPLAERLLREKISLHGICRAVGVSIRRLIDFMVARFWAAPDHLHAQPIASPQDVILGLC